MTGRNILVNGNILTESGDINLIADNNEFQTGSFQGIHLNGSSVNLKTLGGNISLSGRGSSNSNNPGVSLLNATLSVTGAGNISIFGTSGNGTDVSACGIGLHGGLITASNGSVSINGITNSMACLSSDFGVYIIGTTISSNGSGQTRIIGNPGDITGGSALGVLLQDAHISGFGNSSILIDGTTGNSSSGDRLAINIGTSTIRSQDGTILISGLSNGLRNYDCGVVIHTFSSVISYGLGNISILGTSGKGAGNYQYAVSIDTMSKVQSFDGSINISGLSRGVSTSDYGVYIHYDSIVSSLGNGSIKIEGVSGIGYNNDIPWNIKSEIYLFKQITGNKDQYKQKIAQTCDKMIKRTNLTEDVKQLLLEVITSTKSVD